MIKQLGNSALIGLTVHEKDEIQVFSVVESELKKGSLRILRKQSYNSLDELGSNIKGPVHLCFSSPTVLITENSGEFEEALQSILPGADQANFLVQKSVDQDVYAILNLSEVDKIISRLEDIQINVISVSLEPMSVLAIHTFGSIDAHGIEFKVIDGSLASCQENGTTTIDSEHLNGSEILAFGAILSDVQGATETLNIPKDIVLNQEKLKGGSQLKWVTAACVLLLLGLSLTNLFFYQSYNAELQSLSKDLIASNASQERLNSLKARVDAQNQLMSSLNTISPKKGAFLIDQLCERMPSQINLDYIGLESPERIKKKKQIQFREDAINIQGKTVSTMALNNWIYEINEMNDVKQVRLESYEDTKENRGQFSLEISLDVE